MRVSKSKSFWNLLPVRYFLSQYERSDCRHIEVDIEFKILFFDIITRDFLKGAIYLSSEEQNILDNEIATMQFGFEGSTVMSLMRYSLVRSQTHIEKSLDKIEAKYHAREFAGLDPKPPRRYENRFLTYWYDFFEMII